MLSESSESLCSSGEGLLRFWLLCAARVELSDSDEELDSDEEDMSVVKCKERSRTRQEIRLQYLRRRASISLQRRGVGKNDH